MENYLKIKNGKLKYVCSNVSCNESIALRENIYEVHKF